MRAHVVDQPGAGFRAVDIPRPAPAGGLYNERTPAFTTITCATRGIGFIREDFAGIQ